METLLPTYGSSKYFADPSANPLPRGCFLGNLCCSGPGRQPGATGFSHWNKNLLEEAGSLRGEGDKAAWSEHGPGPTRPADRPKGTSVTAQILPINPPI